MHLLTMIGSHAKIKPVNKIRLERVIKLGFFFVSFLCLFACLFVCLFVFASFFACFSFGNVAWMNLVTTESQYDSKFVNMSHQRVLLPIT